MSHLRVCVAMRARGVATHRGKARLEQISYHVFQASTGKNWGTLMASVKSPDTLSLPVIKAFVESIFPSAIASQTLLLVVKVTSGFSTPPGITRPTPLEIWKAQIPGSSPVIFHCRVLFTPAAAAGLNFSGIDSKSSAIVMVVLSLPGINLFGIDADTDRCRMQVQMPSDMRIFQSRTKQNHR